MYKHLANMFTIVKFYLYLFIYITARSFTLVPDEITWVSVRLIFMGGCGPAAATPPFHKGRSITPAVDDRGSSNYHAHSSRFFIYL